MERTERLLCMHVSNLARNLIRNFSSVIFQESAILREARHDCVATSEIISAKFNKY